LYKSALICSVLAGGCEVQVCKLYKGTVTNIHYTQYKQITTNKTKWTWTYTKLKTQLLAASCRSCLGKYECGYVWQIVTACLEKGTWAWSGMLLNQRRPDQLFWTTTTFPWSCLTNDGKLLANRPRPLPHPSLSAFILSSNKAKFMHLIHRHVTDKAAEWVSVQLRHCICDAEWPIVHLQILEQILRLFTSLSCNFDEVTILNLNWHLSENCPYLSIQQCGHVQHKHRIVDTPTMCHFSSENPHTLDRTHNYATLRHLQDGLQTLIQFAFYVSINKRSSAFITNE
jgi:hypothetical protein